MPFVGQAKGKGVYGRYRSVCSNFATLNHVTGGNRNGKRLRQGELYPNGCYIIMYSGT